MDCELSARHLINKEHNITIRKLTEDVSLAHLAYHSPSGEAHYTQEKLLVTESKVTLSLFRSRHVPVFILYVCV